MDQQAFQGWLLLWLCSLVESRGRRMRCNRLALEPWHARNSPVFKSLGHSGGQQFQG